MNEAPVQPPEIAPGNLRVVGYWTRGAIMFRVEKLPGQPLPDGHSGVVADHCDKAFAMQLMDDIERDWGGHRTHKGCQLLIQCGHREDGCSDPDEEPDTTKVEY